MRSLPQPLGLPGALVLPRVVRQAGSERVDLLQMEIEQEAMVSLDAPAQGFAQPCWRRPDLGMRECGQLGRVGLAGDQRLDHRPAAAAHDVG